MHDGISSTSGNVRRDSFKRNVRSSVLLSNSGDAREREEAGDCKAKEEERETEGKESASLTASVGDHAIARPRLFARRGASL